MVVGLRDVRVCTYIGDKMNSNIILPLPTEALLRQKETNWKVILPEDYKAFIKKENGSIPINSCFDFEHNVKVIERFLAILNISGDKPEEAYDISVVSTQLEGRIIFDENYVGVQLLPIASLFGGDFICFDYTKSKTNPEVCLWIQEESYELEPTVVFVADNFTQFLSILHS